MKKTIILSLLTVMILSGCQKDPVAVLLSADEAKAKASEFLTKNVDPQSVVTEVSDDGDLYKINVQWSNGSKTESGISKDGKKFFPYVISTEPATTTPAAEQAQTTTDFPKTDKPKVELFVMSHCPYGTQIEKGILPVLDTLGDKIDFELKFVDYAMHPTYGELDEQINQYCIQLEQKEKLLPYLGCFLGEGKSEPCLEQAGVDQDKLSACFDSTDEKYKINENYQNQVDFKGQFPSFPIFAEDNVKYGVKGSPALVINGAQGKVNRDPASLLKAVCSAFNTAPDECSEQLSSTAPSSGFGSGSASGSASADCAN